ncbi:hypothetical protein Glove_345g62 [Diversispora epigaea]|uniref:Uncharacterized protein n=1 Tax=Diversispora epigaea TaxID=1348612 RepID=A0A397HKY5_9GLOM|nr:hypothetical protein Glove_345g62 [Diversispora epigaea]
MGKELRAGEKKRKSKYTLTFSELMATKRLINLSSSKDGNKGADSNIQSEGFTYSNVVNPLERAAFLFEVILYREKDFLLA